MLVSLFGCVFVGECLTCGFWLLFGCEFGFCIWFVLLFCLVEWWGV